MVELAAEARHSHIIGELGAEHREQLQHMYREGLEEVTRLRNELGNANIALSIQKSEMGHGEAKFYQTENARNSLSVKPPDRPRLLEWQLRKHVHVSFVFARWKSQRVTQTINEQMRSLKCL